MQENLNDVQVEVLFLSLLEKLNTLKTLHKDISSEVKTLEKTVNKSMKSVKKELDKKKKSKKTPSGFAQPTLVTKELCDFLNLKEGSKLARTEVTKAIIQYIKSNKLQDDENKKKIAPDEKLKLLLGMHQSDQLDYFSLQKYMNKHFISTKKSETLEL